MDNTLGASQEDFLGNVAKALGRDKPLSKKPDRTVIGPPEFWKEDEPLKKRSLELFIENLEKLSGRAFVAKNIEEVNSKINEWLKELKATNVICWNSEELKNVLQPDSLPAKLYYWDNDDKKREELIKAAAQSEVGITWVNYAIAYSGTMAVFSGPNTGRSVSLLPPTHIAIFNRQQLVPTMSSVVRHMIELQGADKLPSAVNFITGPSRTSDIEMDLSIGVHGPYRTWAIILDQDQKKLQ